MTQLDKQMATVHRKLCERDIQRDIFTSCVKIKNDPLGLILVDKVLPTKCLVPVIALSDQESLHAPCTAAPRLDICSLELMLPAAGT